MSDFEKLPLGIVSFYHLGTGIWQGMFHSGLKTITTTECETPEQCLEIIIESLEKRQSNTESRLIKEKEL